MAAGVLVQDGWKNIIPEEFENLEARQALESAARMRTMPTKPVRFSVSLNDQKNWQVSAHRVLRGKSH